MAESTLEQLKKQKQDLLEQVAETQAKIDERLSETIVRCGGCKQAFEVRELEYVQTHWYERPHGCMGGDNWWEGEGQWVCPHCGSTNRLYHKPDIVALKKLFKSVRDTYDK